MKFHIIGPIAAASVAVAFIGMSSALAQSSSVAGIWQSSEGKMELTQNGSDVSGPYDQDEGRVIGTLSGHTLSGIWVERSSDVECDETQDGSRYWGLIDFTFNDDFTGFSGTWTYCRQTGTRAWSGTLDSAAKLIIFD